MSQNHPPRQNVAMANIVEAGISLGTRMGAANAWVFMASADVPLPVVKRVLALPEQRRHASAQ